MTPEGQLKADVVEFLNQVVRWPQFYLRLNSGKVKVRGGWMELCPEGTADFVVFEKSSIVVWLELKDPKGQTAKTRKESQSAFAQKVRELGHHYIRAESISDVKSALGEYR